MNMRRLWAAMAVCALLACQGCESFGRKFIRKPKEKPKSADSMVLRPEEYAPANLSSEERYRVFYTYWKGWHEELIESLEAGANRKHRIRALKETQANLRQMQDLIDGPKAEALEICIIRLSGIADELNKNASVSFLPSLRSKSEKLKSDIERDFSFRDVKDELVGDRG